MSGGRRRFDGRAAIVTGASRGIGLAIAQTLLADGARVCITARGENELAAAAEALDAGDRLIAVAGSSDDARHRRDAIAETVAAFGAADLLVNNAATNPLFETTVTADLEAVRKIIEVNVVAALGWIQEVHATWMGRHGGAIVNVSSAGGVMAGELLGPYNVSKAALIHLTRQLGLELAPAIRVNAIAPAVVRTRFAGPLLSGDEAALADLYPLRRLGEPADAANLAAFLLSEEASWITGQTVLVDGGITLSDPGGRRERAGSAPRPEGIRRSTP